MRGTLALAAAGAAALVFTAAPADAHCTVGKRFFPAGLAVEDPCAADELSFLFTHIKEPGEEDEPARKRSSFEFEFSKRIVEDFAVSVGTAYNILKARGEERRTGWENLELGFRYQFLTLPKSEFVASAGLSIELGRTGTTTIGEHVTVYTPTLFLGKGMGDLPDSVALLRPLAFTGTIGWAIPEHRTSATSETDEDTGEVTFSRTINPKVLKWNFSIQYSIPYLQSNVRDVGLEAPFNRLIPVVEFDFEMPTNGPDRNRVSGKILPGLIWTSRYGQVGLAAIIPINARTGDNVGVIAQLHFYLDDIAPSVFGKPLFRTRP
jgi:hypothetical protein